MAIPSRLTDAPSVPSVPWDDFLRDFAWEQGEHVTLIGPTKQGKTTLARHILTRRRFVVVIATKPRDENIAAFREQGFKIWRDLPLPPSEIYPRVVFWPRSRQVKDRPKQKRAIIQLLVSTYQGGGDCLYLDETAEISDDYKLEPLVKLILRQGRTSGISMVNGTQRPRDIPLLAYSMARHLFFWRTEDEVDLKRVAGLAGANRRIVATAVMNLEAHSFLYRDSWTGRMAVSRVDVGRVA